MKKKLAALLAIAATVGASAGVVGCGDNETPKQPVNPNKPGHDHILVWENEDDDQHWKYCTVDGCDYVEAQGDHVDEIDNETGEAGEDGICDVCGYEYPNDNHGHSHNLVWYSDDADEHWQYCDVEGCDFVGDKTAHVDEIDNETGEDGADGKCDVCGRILVVGEHPHVYEYGSDDEYHWQYCTVPGCTEVGEKEAHVDEINNETEEDGADGKCDVCGRLKKYTVTFDVGDHDVAAPEAQKVEHGKTAKKPADLAQDGDYEFAGWYAADKMTAFDFTAPITGDTVVYAVWTARLGTQLNPVVLTLGDQKLRPIQKGEKVYFTFTSADLNRYTIALANGTNSRKCRFTTSLDEDDVWYGNGCEQASKSVDLNAGSSITITLTCTEDLAEGATAAVIVNETTDEPLPEDKYLDGLYKDSGGVYQVEIDREKEIVNFRGNPIGFRYVGGSIDELRFTAATTDYRFKYVSDGVYTLSWVNGGQQQSETLEIFNEDDMVDLSEFAGIYEPGEDGTVMSVSKIVVDGEGNGYYEMGGKRSYYLNAPFEQISGRLQFTLVDVFVIRGDEGTVGLEVRSTDTKSGIVIKNYTRTGDAPAQILETLPIGDGDYSGNKYTIRKRTNYTYWGANGENSILVDGYDGKEFYTITASGTVYKLTISDEGVIALYDETGKTLLDTLKKPEQTALPELIVSDIEQTYETKGYITVTDTFRRNHTYKFFEVKESGYYMFTTSEDFLNVYVGVSVDNPESIEMYVEPVNYYEMIQIEAGTVVALGFDGYAVIPETVSLTFAAVTPPATGAADDPFIVKDEGFGLQASGDMMGQQYYYFSFTAPADGNYQMYFRYWDNDYWTYNYKVYFTVDGNEYGYKATYDVSHDSYNGEWVGGTSADDPYYRCALTAGQTVILIACLSDKFMFSMNTVTLYVEPDTSAYTAIDEDSPISNGLDAGAYVFNGYWATSAIGFKFTSDSEFTVTVGAQIDIKLVEAE